MSVFSENSHRTEIVDISDEAARRYWARRLKVSEDALKSAVRATRQVEFSKLNTYLESTRLSARFKNVN